MVNKTSTFILAFCCSVLFFVGCSKKGNESENNYPLVTVDGKILYKAELDDFIPKGMDVADSTLAAEAYIKMWIKNELIYDKAKDNVTDQEKIDELVENYRQSLTIYTYQEQLLRERLANSLSEKELKEYYNANSESFVLQNSIIRGLFLKVPQTSLRLEDLKKWYKSKADNAMENIEKYSLENAVIYDYFINGWVDFDEVMSNIPVVINNPEKFLKENKTLEAQDSLYVYLLNIQEYILPGNTAPYEFAESEISDILLSRKRIDFMDKFEKDLYESAIKNNRVKFHKN